MLNYKDCDINDFNEALRMKNEPLESLSDQVLYILYTKFKADARQCFYAGTSYSNGLAMDSEKQSAIYKQELEHRGYEVTEIDCVKKKSLLEAVQYAYDKGYFVVTDSYGYGCMGLHCETNGAFSNGFYCFGEDAEGFEGTPEEYVAFTGKENICKSISDTIQAMIEDESFPEEACAYLNDMLQICQTETGEYDAAIMEWMIKAEKVVEKEFE